MNDAVAANGVTVTRNVGDGTTAIIPAVEFTSAIFGAPVCAGAGDG